MKLSNRVYDILKTCCTVVIPAVSVLYATLSEIWGLPLATQICGTLAGIAVFIGALIGLSSKKYWEEEGE